MLSSVDSNWWGDCHYPQSTAARTEELSIFARIYPVASGLRRWPAHYDDVVDHGKNVPNNVPVERSGLVTKRNARLHPDWQVESHSVPSQVLLANCIRVILGYSHGNILKQNTHGRFCYTLLAR